jgi:hypothetical protein
MVGGGPKARWCALGEVLDKECNTVVCVAEGAGQVRGFGCACRHTRGCNWYAFRGGVDCTRLSVMRACLIFVKGMMHTTHWQLVD